MRSNKRFAIAVGAGLGLAWGAGLRGWMAVLAGGASQFTLAGTFGGVLLPAALVGGSLGWAADARRRGSENGQHWVKLTPLLFIAMPALVQEGFVAGLRTGLGTGAIGIALIGMLGGYAIGGRGPRWAYTLARVVLLLLAAAAIVAGLFMKPIWRQGERAATELYLLIAFLAFAALLAAGCAIPYLETRRNAPGSR